jgi:CRISPR-associated protein Cmr2
MAVHLMALALGPVQDFIAAARRTRDLWFGSRLLSDISKAAAQALQARGAELIFPAPEALAEGDAGVANVILARLPETLSPAAARKAAFDAADLCWQTYAQRARGIVRGIINGAVWDDQVGDVIEFYAAAVPLESDDGYAKARRQVMRLLAGRKACRDFRPAKGRRLPKSSLDGARETVLRREGDSPQVREAYKALRKRLRLSAGEQLDTVGMVKRLAGGEHAVYPSVSRLAADPWLRGLAAAAPERLKRLRDICRGLTEKGLTQVGETRYADFPHEGTAVYRRRLRELAQETGEPPEAYAALDSAIKQLEKDFGEPDPYLAILAADGDGMGAAISGIVKEERHRDLSEKLAEFAREARVIVQNEAHRGVLVYSGGDDVLAFLPVDTCLTCARELHEEFGRRLSAFAGPTLSVGIAIGHFLEPLEDLLNFARAAERDAKGTDRDVLAVHVHTRGGAPLTIRAQWPRDMDKQLLTLAGMHARNEIPDKAAYDLRELAMAYTGWPRETDEEDMALDEAIRADVGLLLKRKRVADPNVLKTVLAGGEGAERWTAEGVRRMAERIIVARRIHASRRQAERTAGPSVEAKA